MTSEREGRVRQTNRYILHEDQAQYKVANVFSVCCSVFSTGVTRSLGMTRNPGEKQKSEGEILNLWK